MNTENPIIGRDIAWSSIDGQYLRVVNVAYLGTVTGAKVKGPPSPLPYALITVESPRLGAAKADLPIVHKVDFLHLWEALRNRGLRDSEECLVARLERKGGWFGKVLPSLHIRITAKGQLERIYDEHTPANQRAGPAFAKWSPQDR
jgi:hypothetical protein